MRGLSDVQTGMSLIDGKGEREGVRWRERDRGEKEGKAEPERRMLLQCVIVESFGHSCQTVAWKQLKIQLTVIGMNSY